MADVRLPVSLLKTDPLVPPPDTVDDSDREGRPYPHWVGGSRKRSEQSTNADQKSLETVFSIAICRRSCENWQWEPLFLTIYDLRSSIVVTFSNAAYTV